MGICAPATAALTAALTAGAGGGIAAVACARVVRVHAVPGHRKPRAMKPIVVCIEGLIGVGKSTALAHLSNVIGSWNGVAIVREPVDEWSSNGFLDDMYTGRASKAAFQFMALDHLSRNLKAAIATGAQLIVTERSLWGNFEVFAKNSLSKPDLAMYKSVWQRAVDSFDVDLHFVYLKAPAAHCMARVAARQREGEGAVTVDYLTALELAHDEWLFGQANVDCVDATKDEMAVFNDVLVAVTTRATPLICTAVPAGNYRAGCLPAARSHCSA